MALPSQTVSVILGRVDDETSERNFQQVQKAFAGLATVSRGRTTGDVILAAGNNNVTLPGGVRNPVGRIVVYQSAASNLYDVGLVDGVWVINSSAPCTCRFLFF